MTTLRLKIGAAFPADDPVARFVTLLAMMSNDWLRIISDVIALDGDDPDSVARRIMLFRQQAALHHEAALRLEDAPKRFKEIADFVTGLSADAKKDYDIVVSGHDPASEHYLGQWHESHRHVTFHYPVLHPDRAEPGNEELKVGLEKAAHLDSTITWEEGKFISVRFSFADEVAVQWLPDAETQAELVARLRESGLALARYVQRAAQAYLDSLPKGTFTADSES